MNARNAMLVADALKALEAANLSADQAQRYAVLAQQQIGLAVANLIQVVLHDPPPPPLPAAA